MPETIKICNNVLQVKEWSGQRVVTFKDIDRIHDRPEGTARKRFSDNKSRLVENEDYFKIKKSDIQKSEKRTLEIEIPNRGITVLTESGYLLLVKSFTDDLAWKVQRDLVNTYFKFKEVMEAVQPIETNLTLPAEQFADALDTLTTCAAVFQNMIEYSTINYKQQQELLQAAKQRVNLLLGGAHSSKYKEYSRIYFKNLWNDFCNAFQCGSYKDLNLVYMGDEIAINWIEKWKYNEK